MKHYYYAIAGILLTLSAWITMEKSHTISSDDHVTQSNVSHEKVMQNRSSTSTQERSDSLTKTKSRSPELIANAQYNERVQEQFLASIDALYSDTDEPQKQQAMEAFREHLQAVYHLPYASEKLKEFFESGPADIVNELLFDVSEIQHPMQASLLRAAAKRNDSQINSAILLHLEQQSGETFDDIDSALSWTSNKTF